METTTIVQDVFFAASVRDVFRIFTEAKEHAAISGSERIQIDARRGGKFVLFDTKVTGTFLDLVTDERIVQQWRSEDWPAAHYSRLELVFAPINEGRGAHLQLIHSDVPTIDANNIAKNWREVYWKPMAEHLRSAKVAVVRHFLDEFKNKVNIDIVDETWTEDCVLHLPGPALPPGREAQKAVGRAIFAAMGEVHVTCEDTIVEGDRVVERHRATAVHKGEFMGIPATGKKVFWTENHIYRIRDGKIAEAWSEVSFHDLMGQLKGTDNS